MQCGKVKACTGSILGKLFVSGLYVVIKVNSCWSAFKLLTEGWIHSHGMCECAWRKENRLSWGFWNEQRKLLLLSTVRTSPAVSPEESSHWELEKGFEEWNECILLKERHKRPNHTINKRSVQLRITQNIPFCWLPSFLPVVLTFSCHTNTEPSELQSQTCGNLWTSHLLTRRKHVIHLAGCSPKWEAAQGTQKWRTASVGITTSASCASCPLPGRSAEPLGAQGCDIPGQFQTHITRTIFQLHFSTQVSVEVLASSLPVVSWKSW